MTKQPEQIVAAAAGKIDEELLAAAFAKPRGATTAVAGGVGAAREIGSQWAGKQHKGAAAAGIELGNPGAIAVTPTSLVTMSVGVSLTGKIKEVKQVLSSVPLGAVDSLEVSRFGLAGVLKIELGESSFKLEGKVDDLREVAAAFERAKATT
ncbi:MAG: hypothetical protein QOI10_2387 [Solirubrobacterales bacterium]|jgi:hypothetical protein|nr:hypothetical protein [Solirubrobacterales bacterium]